MNNRSVGDASDYTYIKFLAFLTFGNINIEDSPEALGPTHAPRVIRLIRLAVFFIYEFRAVLAALRCSHLCSQIAVRSKHAIKSSKVESRRWDESG